MVQNYIVMVIGLLTAAYIVYKVVRALVPHSREDSPCPGCSSCPASGRRRERSLCTAKPVTKI